jgi:hypothetical protein
MLPKGNSVNASIIALDENGSIVYCTPGAAATSMMLPPPDSGWGSIDGITYDGARFYVLDSGSNTIWIYISSSGTFDVSPVGFFDDQVPVLTDIVDFAVTGNDLFILHEDGHLTTCTYSEVGSPTKCKDPAPFDIKKPGKENKPVIIPDTAFTRIQYSQPPDPSIYLMDSINHTLYHFSLKLNLQKEIGMQNNDPFRLEGRTATGFSISPGKMIFLAFGNKVFYGMEP